MDFVSGLATEGVFKLLSCAGREIKKCFWLRAEIRYTEGRLDGLQRQVKDVNSKLIEEDRKPLKAVEGWKKDVVKTRANFEKLKGDFERNFKCKKGKSCAGGCRNFWHGEKFHGEERNGCFGVLPFFWHRYKISRQVYDCEVKVEGLEILFREFQGNYVGRPYPVLRHPGSYTEEEFEEEIPKIKESLMKKEVQIIGLQSMDSDCTTSLLTIVHNNDEVTDHFDDMIFFVEIASSSTCDIEAARNMIGGAIGLPAPVLLNTLFTRFSREKFPFLLLLNDLQDGFNLKMLEKMLTGIGLPSLKEKECKIVFSSKSEAVVAAMSTTQTYIEVSPRKEPSWMASLKAQESIHEVKIFREEMGKLRDFTKIKEPSPVNTILIQIPDLIHVVCVACILQFFCGYDNLIWVSLTSWLFVLTSIYLLWWWRTRRREPNISAVGSSIKMERSYSEEWRTVRSWFSWDRNPQTLGDDITMGFQTKNEEAGSSSRFGRRLDGESEPEIVPIDD